MTGSAAVRSGAGTLKSMMLESLFEQVDEDSRVTVFDVGPAIPETVDFFAQRQCRLFFVDLFSEPFIRNQDEKAGDEGRDQEEERLALIGSFEQSLSLPPATQIDICLFWDFLNYLNLPALCAFNDALRPFLHKHTLGHGFSLLNARTSLENQRYGIASSDHIAVRPRNEAQLTPHQHSLSELQRSFDGFTVSRSTLMADGRLEMLLNSRW